jgi:hypothetical protein
MRLSNTLIIQTYKNVEKKVSLEPASLMCKKVGLSIRRGQCFWHVFWFYIKASAQTHICQSC